MGSFDMESQGKIKSQNGMDSQKETEAHFPKRDFEGNRGEVDGEGEGVRGRL